MDSNTYGDAPCDGCGRHVEHIELVLESREPDDKDGWWWKVKPGQQCPHCGKPFNWYHQRNLPKEAERGG